ncbi:MAG: alpha-amylase family glycosyl hydrolase [Myxococcaceae bacterium]
MRTHLWIPLLCAALAFGCPNESSPRLYRTADQPPPGLVTDRPVSLLDEAGPAKVELTREGIRALRHLGPSLMEDAEGGFRGVNFSVYSQRADKVRLLLFDDPESNRATQQFDMTRVGDVWNLFVEGVGLGQHYGFIAWGPNWQENADWYPGSIFGFNADVDTAGNRFNPNKLLFDPYCRAFHRKHDWSKGSAGTGPHRAELDYGAAMKCVVVKSQYAWSPEEEQWRKNRQDPAWSGHRAEDAILYEVHVKGFTMNSASGVEHFGTYRGFAEKADYFKDLGITTVALLPPFEKALDAGYWGYNTLAFFSPELSYASRRQQAEVIDEFKFMVEELHKRGIEVLIDVVYNHTGEGGLWRQKIKQGQAVSDLVNLDPEELASLFSYRGLDNASYYALAQGNNKLYSNQTGVGNETRCNNSPMRRLIVDSARFWVEEMHVDGFRFDLAPVLGEKDLEYWLQDDPRNTVLQDIIDDPVLQKYNVRVIAEPWGGGGGGFQLGNFPNSTGVPGYGWGEWNGHFRDWWRSFANAKGGYQTAGVTADEYFKLNSQVWDGYKSVRNDGYFVMNGSRGYFEPSKRKPYHSVNFITIHDGFTMYDMLSFDAKRNDCSPLNPICCENQLSPYCDEARKSGEDNNRSRNWGMDGEDLKRQQMRNFFVAMMIGHGTPLLYGGDEWMRTQLGNNNTYTPEADNPYSWFDWGSWEAKDERWRMHDFVRQLIKFRKEHAYAFVRAEYEAEPVKSYGWKNAQGADMAPTDWDKRQVMIHYKDPGKGPELAILINFEVDMLDLKKDMPVNFTLPGLSGGRGWKRVVDTQLYFDSPAYLSGSALPLRSSANVNLKAPVAVPATYEVKGKSIVILEAR